MPPFNFSHNDIMIKTKITNFMAKIGWIQKAQFALF